MKQAGHQVRGVNNKEDLHKIARSKNIPLEVTENVVKPGWLEQNEGLLQVLYERGFMNGNNYRKYILEAKKDENGEVREESLPFSLRNLMSSCADLKNEKSVM